MYVRQSTPSQMVHHTESLARQYELRERAVMLGWPAHQVVVIDADLGRSGAQTDGRTGFKELVADVGLGKVGIVLGIEVSRLARNNADWYQLLDLCAITDTLIADADGVYHPADFNDRLVLGLKGTMSEAELHLIKSRLTAGLKHKAAKGELRQGLPVGLDYDEDDRVVMTPDEAVREAIDHGVPPLRGTRLGAAGTDPAARRRGAVAAPAQRLPAHHLGVGDLPGGARLSDQPGLRRGVRVRPHPHRKARGTRPPGPCTRGIGWCRASNGRCSSPNIIAGYISWETYEANTARLRGNWRRPRELAGGAVREGRALLQGLLRCGRCGRIMQTGYSGTTGNCPRYLCARAKQLYAGEHVCQSIGGIRLENRVLDEMFAVLAPAALAATAQALAEADANYRRDLAVFEIAIERARYEADRARRQFDNVEPENRLVARTLEKNLETKLAAVRAAENDLATQRARRPVALTQQELDWIATAGADIRAIFDAPTTTVRERKQLIRAVIAEIGITVHRQRRVADLRIVWQGGAVTEVSMPMTKAGRHLRVTDEDTIVLVRRLARHYNDQTIAAILAKQKRRTATGLPFTRARVAILRANHGIPVYQPPAQPDVGPDDDDAVVVTITEAERILAVSKETLYRWIRDGFITAEQITPSAPWRIRIDQALRDRIQPEAPDGWLGLDEAAKALGVARQTVLHKVQRGELQAVHVNRGRRKGLRIQVKPDQPGLFDTTDRRNAQC